MNRFVRTALAFAVAGSAAHAGTGDNEWKALDSEISGLASSLKPSEDGSGWSALIRGVYTHSSDDIATAGGSDTSGFNFNDVDMAFWGHQGPYRWRVSADIDNNEAGSTGAFFELEDAYIAFMCAEYFETMMGNYKPHVSRSNTVDPENMFFIDRSAIGSSFDGWDNGIGLNGSWEQLQWFVDLMNGSNGHESDHLYVFRAMWMLGSGVGDYDGARGSSDTLNGTIGATYLNDDTVGDVSGDDDHDDDVILVDFHGNVSNIGFGGEIASFGDDMVRNTDEDFSNIFSPATSLTLSDDSQPWNVYVTYLINPEWEVGVRYEDLDNDELLGVDAAGAGNTLLTVAASWYRAGSAGKWTAQWTDIDADETGTPDGSIIEVGFALGASR